MTTSEREPIGAVLAGLQRAIDHRFDVDLAHAGTTRREWQIMATMARGVSNLDALTAAVSAFMGPGETVGPIVESAARRGLVALDGDVATLTPSGRVELERTAIVVDGVRRRLVAGLAPGEYDRTIATLRTMTGNLAGP